MASPLATKRLQRELKALHKNPLTNPKIIAAPQESNILEWHYVLEGPAEDSKSPYHGGIYHGKLIFPKEYPYKPPGVIMCTPNGRFKINRRLCLSMSDFHPESWNPMWSISTILMGLYSFMLENKPTTGSMETTDAEKRKFAKESLQYNIKNNEKIFGTLFPQYMDLWNERVRLEKEEEEKKKKQQRLAEEQNNNLVVSREDNRTTSEIRNGGGGGGHGGNNNNHHPYMDALLPMMVGGGRNNMIVFGAGFVAILSVLFFAILRFC